MKTKLSKRHTIITSSWTEDTFRSISLPGERWKQARGFSSNYFVSDMGRLLTLTHHGGRHPAIMRPARDANGYLRTVMDGRTVKVHRVVAENWLENPYGLPCVNHLDSDRSNNSVTNLEWCTVKYNAWYGVHHGSIRVSRHPRQDLVSEKIRRKVTAEARKFISRGKTDKNGTFHPNRGDATLADEYKRLCRKYPSLARVKLRTLRSWLDGRTCPSACSRQNLTTPSVCERHHTHIVSEENIVFPCIIPGRRTSPVRPLRTSE